MAKGKEKRPGKKAIDSPDPLLGDRIRAGTLLSVHLRKIAQEQTEFITDSDGDRMASKAEALARLMWKMALGYTEHDVKTDKEVVVRPDRGMIALIWDRIEGRAIMSGADETKKRSLPDRVSEQSRNRINNLAGGDDSK